MRRRAAQLRAAAAAAALALAGCSVTTEDQPVAISGGFREAQTPQMSQVFNQPPAVTDRVQVFLVRAQRFYPVDREVFPGTVPVPALEALVVGPTGAETARGFSSALPAGMDYLPVRLDQRLATIELPAELARLRLVDQVYAVGQVVLTATSGGSIRWVQFVDQQDRPIEVPTGSGRIASRVRAADYAAIAGT
jgi:hypothetical protein